MNTCGSKHCLCLLFDMDGTLIDSERETDEAIRTVLAPFNAAPAQLPPEQTRGRSWLDIADALLQKYACPWSRQSLAEQLEISWLGLVAQPTPLPGAVAAIHTAAKDFRLAVVSSSNTHVIERAMHSLGLQAYLPRELMIGADQVTRPKPDPEGYLLAAERLGVAPGECVVFEDSSAGLRAARAAGMDSIAVLACSAEAELCRRLATASIHDYAELTLEHWQLLANHGAEAWRKDR